MNRAAKGTRGERDIIAQLEAEGWECYKSAASKGAFDVIALRPSQASQKGIILASEPYVAIVSEVPPMEIKVVQVRRFKDRRGYGVKSTLAKLRPWGGYAWVSAWLAERQDGQRDWTWTEARRSE